MAKIAIVGCGWLGFPLAVSILNKGVAIVGTTTSEDKLEKLKAAGIHSQVWSLDEVNPGISFYFLQDIDVLILNIPPRKNTSSFSYSAALELICTHIPVSVKVLFISTTGVYPDSLEIADEDYIWSKSDHEQETVLAEIKLERLLKKRLTILRFAGLLGGDRHPVKHLSGKTDIPNGLAPVNLIHLNDAIGLIERIIETNYWGQVVNGCYPFHPTRNDYYSAAAVQLNLPPPHFELKGNNSKIISSEKSICDLGYKYSTKI